MLYTVLHYYVRFLQVLSHINDWIVKGSSTNSQLTSVFHCTRQYQTCSFVGGYEVLNKLEKLSM